MPHNHHSPIHNLLIRFFALILMISADTAVATRTVTLAWDANPEADIAGYRLHYGISSEHYTEIIDVGSSTTATVPNLVAGVTYFFVVTAYNTAALESLPSNEASFTATIPEPLTLGGNFSGASIGESVDPNFRARLSVLDTGRFTGKLMLGSESFRLRGAFAPDGTAVLGLEIANGVFVRVTLRMDAQTGTIDARVTDRNGEKSVTLTQKTFTEENPAPQAGTYTLILGAFTPSGAETPQVDPMPPGNAGAATVFVSRSGAVRTVGRLADGEKFAATSVLQPDGSFSIYQPLYLEKNGLLAGNFFIRDGGSESDGDGDGDGTVWWNKPADVNSTYFPRGLAGSTPALLSRFNSFLLFTSGQRFAEATLSGGNIPQHMDPIEHRIVVMGARQPGGVGFDQDRLEFRINLSNGLIRGSFIHPIDRQVKTIRGVVFQKQNILTGFFPGLTTTGSFTVRELPAPAADQ